ncbi:MAG: diguanylate cyclase, partial [Huintestinicola sp.]
MAIGLMEELKASGIRVPQDVIITGYDNCEIAELTVPRLTTTDRGEYEAGVLAYEKLVANINNSETGSRYVIFGKPVFAGSCGCCCETKRDLTECQSAVELKINMDDSLDLIKGLTLGFSNMNMISDFQQCLERYINKIGFESFYFCQCGSRESYYEELELIASGTRIKKDMTVYQDTVWCPIAFENGRWHSYPSYSRQLLFPPGAEIKNKGGYYIVMPVHQGETCMGYSIIGNFNNSISGRVLQHLVLGIDAALGNIRRNDIMSTMLARINHKWQYDELTGLYNRSGLINNAEKLIEKAISEHKGFSVIFLDLDGLKAVNDEKGHEAGDQYIRAMAEILKKCTNDEDIVCRYGGDEYIVISVQKTLADSMEKLNAVQNEITKPVSASAGCVFDHVRSMDELNRLIEEADKKMYTNKREKKLNR